MEIPEKLTIVEGFYFTDGGSIVLICEGPDGGRHQITLGQHRIFKGFDPNVIPGRLYFDHLPVTARSEEEGRVIAALETGEIGVDEEPAKEEGDEKESGGPVVIVGDDLKEYYAKMAQGKAETIRHLRNELIKYVQSREYVKLAKKMARKLGE